MFIVSTFLRKNLNFPTLGIQQRDKLEEIIIAAYEKAGVTSNKETWDKELKFDRIQNELKGSDDKIISSVLAYLRKILRYNLFSGQKKLSIDSILKEGNVTHLNLKALPDSLRVLFADLFLRKLYYSLQSKGPIAEDVKMDKEKFRLFVIVDEAKLLVVKKQEMKAVLNKYATELRKFGVGLILASQLVTHFTGEILGNIATKLCMKPEDKEQAKKNSKHFEVKPKDLKDLHQGEGFLIMGNGKMKIKIEPIRDKV